MTAIEPKAAIKAALLLLAGLDQDGAAVLNDVGFNSRDTNFGRSLAAQVSERGTLSPKQWAAAHRMLQTYKNTQLAAAGITLPAYDELNQALQADEAHKAAGVAALTSGGLIPLAGRPAEKVSDGIIDIRGGLVWTTFTRGPNFSQLLDVARSLEGRKYTGAPDYANTWPLAVIDRVCAAFPTLDKSPAVEAQLTNLAELIVAEKRRQAAAEAKQYEGYAAKLAKLGDLTKPINGRTPMEHQVSGIQFLLKRDYAIVADDMGLGKTFTALMAAKAYDLPVIVICPKSLMQNWLREAAIVELPIEVYSWSKICDRPAGPFVLIADEVHYAKTYGYYTTDKKTGAPKVVGTRRTADFLNLASGAAACFALSGTPVKNGRPAELFPLLMAIRHPLSANKKGYEKRYCNARATRFSQWDTTGATWLKELHTKIEPYTLYRTKDECLDLPAKNRVFAPADISEADWKAYETEFARMRAEYEAKLQAKEAEAEALRLAVLNLAAEMRGMTPDQMAEAEAKIEEMEAARNKLNNARNADAVVLLTHLRKAGATAKAGDAIERTRQLIEAGQSVVIYTNFVDTAHRLGRELECEVIDGAAKDRQGIVDRFQSGQHKAIVITSAGGVGITLTAATNIILLDRPWTPGDAEQAEDRIYRIGQTKKVTAFWLQSGKVDEKIDSALVQKAKQAKVIMTGKSVSGAQRAPSIADIAADILAEVFSD